MYLPRDTENTLVARDTCYRDYYGYYNCHSSWYRWGRWVLAGILIFIGVIFLFACLFVTRRRRRRNQISNTSQPMAYTAPTGRQDYDYSQPPPQGQTYASPPGAPPQYGGGANQDYYGVQQPQNAYVKREADL